MYHHAFSPLPGTRENSCCRCSFPKTHEVHQCIGTANSAASETKVPTMTVGAVDTATGAHTETTDAVDCASEQTVSDGNSTLPCTIMETREVLREISANFPSGSRYHVALQRAIAILICVTPEDLLG